MCILQVPLLLLTALATGHHFTEDGVQPSSSKSSSTPLPSSTFFLVRWRVSGGSFSGAYLAHRSRVEGFLWMSFSH